jgi:hypothetical protein
MAHAAARSRCRLVAFEERMARFFTLSQAQQALPAVEKLLRDALYFRSEHQQAQEQLQAISRQITLMGGTRVDPEKIGGLQSTVESSIKGLERAIEDIQESGCLVKDLDIGLIDFPTLYHGREVYLCWQFGEPGIQYWHGIEEGFRGRKSIDQEFIANHGESVTS